MKKILLASLLLSACTDDVNYPVAVDPGIDASPDASVIPRTCKNVNYFWDDQTHAETLEVHFECALPGDAAPVQGVLEGASSPQQIKFDLVCGNNFFTLTAPYVVDEFHPLTLGRLSAQIWDVECTK